MRFCFTSQLLLSFLFSNYFFKCLLPLPIFLIPPPFLGPLMPNSDDDVYVNDLWVYLTNEQGGYPKGWYWIGGSNQAEEEAYYPFPLTGASPYPALNRPAGRYPHPPWPRPPPLYFPRPTNKEIRKGVVRIGAPNQMEEISCPPSRALLRVHY